MPVAPLRSLRLAYRPLAAMLLIGTSAVATAAMVSALQQDAPREDRRSVCTIPRAKLEAMRAEPTCKDPIAGVWVAGVYRPEQRDWTSHELRIRKDAGEYVVEHTARVRDDEHHARSLGCTPDNVEFDTTGRATLDGNRLHVRGTKLLATRPRCDGASMSYDLDSFAGTVAGESFDSVNNDGATAVNRRYRFTRLTCE